MPKPTYRYLDHTAEIGLSADGSTLNEAFEQAALGLAHLMADPDTAITIDRRQLSVDGIDTGALLVALLNECIFLFDTEMVICMAIRITERTDTYLVADVTLGKIADESQTRTMVKATTYHALDIKEGPEGASVQVIFDI